MGGLVLVGIRSSSRRILYFFPFGNNFSSICTSSAVGFFVGIIVSKSIKSFSSPKSMKSFSWKFNVSKISILEEIG